MIYIFIKLINKKSRFDVIEHKKDSHASA